MNRQYRALVVAWIAAVFVPLMLLAIDSGLPKWICYLPLFLSIGTVIVTVIVCFLAGAIGALSTPKRHSDHPSRSKLWEN